MALEWVNDMEAEAEHLLKHYYRHYPISDDWHNRPYYAIKAMPRLCRAVRELYEAALKSANAASAAMSYWPDEEQVYEVLERWGRGGGPA